MKLLGNVCSNLKKPVVTGMSEVGTEPFKVLISTLLSLRTRDEITAKVSKRLYEKIRGPKDILKISLGDLEKLIYPVGFYKTKAKTLRHVCQVLLEKYGGQVPDDLDELLSIKGVGRKTANLVVSLGFNKPGLCIDTHCHRIPNRLGWIITKNALETEMKLRKILPKKYWKLFNDYLVAFGQNICKPVGPKCNSCILKTKCDYGINLLNNP